MGKAKRRDGGTDADRQKQRLIGIRKRMRANMAAMNIDIDGMISENPVVAKRAERQSADLRAMHERMRRSAGSTTAPTPERLAHATSAPREIEVRPDQPRAHHFVWPVDAVRERLTMVQYAAAERIRDLHLAMQPKSAVADPTGAGGASNPAKRLALTEKQELAAREFHWVMGRMEGLFRRTIERLALELPIEGRDRAPTLTEHGRAVAKFACEKRAAAAGATAVILACTRLAGLFADWDAWQREQCVATDRLMRSDLGRRAASQGWITALWTWCHANRKLPSLQRQVDEIRALHDQKARALRYASLGEVEKHLRRRDRLTAIAFTGPDSAASVRISACG